MQLLSSSSSTAGEARKIINTASQNVSPAEQTKKTLLDKINKDRTKEKEQELMQILETIQVSIREDIRNVNNLSFITTAGGGILTALVAQWVESGASIVMIIGMLASLGNAAYGSIQHHKLYKQLLYTETLLTILEKSNPTIKMPF